MALMCFAGDAEAGAAALAPFRALAEPLADMVRPIPYPEIYPPEEEGYHPTATAINMFVDSIGTSGAETILEHVERSTAMMGVAQLRVLGGAIARVPNDATAYAHRDRKIMVNVAALYERAEQAEEHAPWVRGFAEALDQGYDGVYANFLADEGSERIRAAYPGATWDRLREIKARYDPSNLFRLNQNVPPAEGGGA
jgi:FAD/FMN-containing dehydrogenase